MSETHGDKARYGRQRQSKVLRSRRLRELTKKLSLTSRKVRPANKAKFRP